MPPSSSARKRRLWRKQASGPAGDRFASNDELLVGRGAERSERPLALDEHGAVPRELHDDDRGRLARGCGQAAIFVPRARIEPEQTRFAQDLEWDSLTVLDFVANIEDEFDVIISMNMQAEIETVGQLVEAVDRLAKAS